MDQASFPFEKFASFNFSSVFVCSELSDLSFFFLLHPWGSQEQRHACGVAKELQKNIIACLYSRGVDI